jgi:hypothetical protein
MQKKSSKERKKERRGHVKRFKTTLEYFVSLAIPPLPLSVLDAISPLGNDVFFSFL